MNQYNSNVRTFVARNVIDTVIAPPANLLLATTDWRTQFFDSYRFDTIGMQWLTQINPASNILLRRLGVFSNFADGLVFATPAQRIDVRIIARPYTTGTPLTGTADWPVGSKTVTSPGANTAFLTEVTPGAILALRGWPGIVESVIDDFNLVMTDYGPGVANVSLVPWVPDVNFLETEYFRIGVLNTMGEHENYFPIGLLAMSAQAYFLQAQVVMPQDITMLTLGIDPAFVGAPVYLDVQAEFEINQI